MFADKYRTTTERLIDLRRAAVLHRNAQLATRKDIYETNSHLPHNQRDALASHAASVHSQKLNELESEIQCCLDELRYFDYALKSLGANLRDT